MRTVFCSALVLMLVGSFAFAGDKENTEKKKVMMQKWMAASTPGEGHKIFAGVVGKWKSSSKFWESAESKPQVSAGSSTLKLILGGRFLEQNFKGKAMGMPFEGRGLTGYNNVTKKYETLWLDNMSTGMMHGEGSFDADSKTLKDSGEYVCPMTEKKHEYRSEWKIIDKDNMTYTMWGTGIEDDKEFKQMEITYKRAQ